MRYLCQALLTAFVCIVFFIIAHKPALAVTEFCTARLELSPIGSSSSQTFGPALTYAAELAAFGPRSVTAQIAFDTNAGWFTAEVPWETFSKKDRFDSTSGNYSRADWVSPVFEVSFPKDVIVTNAWVSAAQGKGDTFGWNAQGVIACLPTGVRATPMRYSKSVNWGDPLFEAADFKQIPQAPAPTVIPATPSTPVESAVCSQPFKDAVVMKQAEPYYPDTSTLIQFPSYGTTFITVALNAQGQAADAWVSESSGNPLFDSSSVTTALHSQYEAPIAYCRSVPGFYIFKVTYE